MKKIVTILSFFLLGGILLFFLCTPDWIITADLSSMEIWYPNLGTLVYFFINTLVYYLLGMATLCLVAINYKYILERIKINSREKLYGLFLLVLILQFGYSLVYTEFYPAVMMPSFSYGKMDPDNLSFNRAELCVFSEGGSVFRVDMVELLDELPNSMRNSVISQSLLKGEKDFNHLQFKKWVAEKMSLSQSISRIEVYEVTRVYKFIKQKVVETEEKRTLLHVIKG